MMLSSSTTKKDKRKISQTNIILGIILILLIIVTGVIVLFSQKGGNSMPLSDLQDKVDIIEITQVGEVTTLVYQEGKWVIANYNNQMAKQEYVQAIFTTLNDLVITDIVSTNPDKQSIYQIGDGGMQVVMKRGDKIVQSFVIGKNGPSYPSSYFRYKDENEVYLVREILPQVFGWGEWRNMTIIQLADVLIEGLKWSNGLEMVREEGVWNAIAPKELIVDSSKIATVIDNLSNLEATDIADVNISDLNQQEPSFVLEIDSAEEVTYRLIFWKHIIEEGDYDYHVVTEGDDNVYVLSKYVAENMDKKIEFLED